MPLSRRVKGRCRTAAAVKEKKTKEKERVNEVRAPENGEGMLILHDHSLPFLDVGLPYCFS